MTNAELITALQKLPQDLPVAIVDGREGPLEWLDYVVESETSHRDYLLNENDEEIEPGYKVICLGIR